MEGHLVLLALRRLVTTAACVCFSVAPLSAQDSRYSEYGVKSAFVFNFFKFIQFPDQESAPELRLCIVAADEAFREFEGLAGKDVDGRLIKVWRLAGDESAAECDALFVSAAHQKFARTLLASAKHSVLSVGEHSDFIGSGGIINFFVEAGKVRFEINTESAAKAQIQISSKLLKLGKITGRIS